MCQSSCVRLTSSYRQERSEIESQVEREVGESLGHYRPANHSTKRFAASSGKTRKSGCRSPKVVLRCFERQANKEVERNARSSPASVTSFYVRKQIYILH